MMMICTFVSLIVQVVFIAMKVFGVLTWDWHKVLCIFEFYLAFWIFAVVTFATIALIMKIINLVKKALL
jgi:hypothetical protein